MAMKQVTIDLDAPLTDAQIKMLNDLENRPVTFDKDLPEFTAEELSEFHRVSSENKKNRRKENISFRLSPQAIRNARALGRG